MPPLRLCDRLLYSEEAIAAAAIAISDLGLDTEPAYEQLDHPVGPLMASWQETPCYVCGFSREYEYLSSVVVVNAETTELMVAMPLLGHEIGVSDFLEYQAPPFENAEISGVEWRIEPGGPAWDLPFPEDRR